MDPEKQLVTYTALAIVAEEDIELIQSIREKHDPAFERWPPHINISFPFVDPTKFDQLQKVLAEEFKDFPAFQLTFKQVSSFPHGVCFVDPETNGNQLQDIYNKVMGKFPELINKKHAGFTPHMTIANKVKKNEVDNLRHKLQQEWKEWRWTCRGIHFLQRDKDTPFRTAKFIAFKK